MKSFWSSYHQVSDVAFYATENPSLILKGISTKIFNNNSNTQRWWSFFRLCFCFYFVSFCYRMHKEWTIFLWFLFLPKTISNNVFKVALYFYLNDIWKNELFTDQKSLSFMWLIMHFCCLNINFKENTRKKQLNLFWWCFIYFFHLIKVLLFIFQGVSFIFTRTNFVCSEFKFHIKWFYWIKTFLISHLSLIVLFLPSLNK